MGLFKGNLGNLMQHWVLCEVLDAAKKLAQTDLFFLGTHGMAPWSQPEPRHNGATHFHRYFDLAAKRLFEVRTPGRKLSAYEEAWLELSPSDGVPYPSSAVFVANKWTGNLSLWLCETSNKIAAEISDWWNAPEFSRSLLGKRIYQYQWQRCFSEPLPLLFEHSEACNLAVLEFDPDMVISQAGTKRENPRLIYYEDLDLVRSLVRRLKMPVILQVSSYSPNYGNTPDAIEAAVTPVFQEDGLVLQGQVSAENSMTSLVYARGVSLWDAAPQSLSAAFHRWLPTV